jgi:hypothetical protein
MSPRRRRGARERPGTRLPAATSAQCLGLVGLGLSGCGVVSNSAVDGLSGSGKAAAVFEGPVPRASCGPGSFPETGMQGSVPNTDRASGRSKSPYTCNLEQVGRVGNGAGWQLAWYEHCAYYGTARAGGQGVQVVDVSSPQRPVISAQLTTPGMLDPWESLKGNDRRGLLAAAENGGPGLDFYDLSGDCAAPTLAASVQPWPGAHGHEGDWHPDGTLYYAAGTPVLSNNTSVMDVTDPSAPETITTFPQNTHGLSVSDDGTRLYLANWSFTPSNGLGIYDVSAINRREPNAQPTPISVLTWEDGTVAQHTIPVRIGGKPFVIFVDEGGNGMARIIDIGDESAPFVVSKLKLEIDMPDAASQRAADADGSDSGSFQYNAHYCSVDSHEDAQVLGCSYFWSGVRIFDIRDPYSPREIAYFNPGGTDDAAPTQQTPGPATAGYASSQVRFMRDRGEIWFTDQRHGFYVARFINGAWPFED